jgi:L-Ala-D/L-Glu epimerase
LRIADLTAIHARIPLKRQVRHASYARSDNDSLLIRCRLDDGTIGWGEGLPRPYVTGETIDSAWEQFAATDLSAGLGASFDGVAEAVQLLDRFELAQSTSAVRDCFGNAARCAIELAVLDAVCRSIGRPLSAVMDAIPEAASVRGSFDRVQYSAAISSTAIPKAMVAAGMYRYYGFAFCKLKVGTHPRGDAWLLRCVRSVAGRAMNLRVDVNEAWPPDHVERNVARLLPSRISAVEQPVPHNQVGSLRELRPRLGVPIVLDESLCSESDARRAIGEGLCDIFNLRLSKCGGFIRSAQLAAIAAAAGMHCQLGCQVGETGILSAAGRHVACSIRDLRYIEGSFDRIIVAEPLIREDITFRRGGWAQRLEGTGLGVTVDEDAVARVTVRCEKRQIANLKRQN